MAGAMSAGAGPTGARTYLASRDWTWLTPRRLQHATRLLLGGALFASTVLIGG